MFYIEFLKKICKKQTCLYHGSLALKVGLVLYRLCLFREAEENEVNVELHVQTNVAENVTTTLIKNDDLILQLNALSEKKY